MGARHRLSYEGSAFHRVIKGQLVQGGDLTSDLRNGIIFLILFHFEIGECIYGRSFDDESFLVNHSGAGITIGKKAEKKIPPNAVCPKCKSGLKYKKCCGKNL